MNSKELTTMSRSLAAGIGALGLMSLLWAAEAAAEVTAQNVLTDQEENDGWRLLFDGRTTGGWRGYGMQGVPGWWQALDGALVRVSGEEGGGGGKGDLVTIEEFDNFELAFEWKIFEKGNSGVLYRLIEGAKFSWQAAVEVQIIDNPRYPQLDPKQLNGACYGLYAPSQDVSRPLDEWNQFRLIVNGNLVEHWLNGTKIVEYELGSPDWNERVAAGKFKSEPLFAKAATGHIGLQDYGVPVQFRNIKIRPLPLPLLSRRDAVRAQGRNLDVPVQVQADVSIDGKLQ